EFFKKNYEKEYDIIESADGLECLKTYIAQLPDIVILSEGLSIVHEFILAKKIRTADSRSIPEIYFCTTADIQDEKNKTLFNGLLKKSAIAENFKRSFEEVVQRKNSDYSTLLKNIKLPLLNAIQQTIKVFFNEEANVTELPDSVNTADFRTCKMNLADVSGTQSITFELAASNEAINKIAQKIQGNEATSSDVDDAFRNLSETISGKLITFLEQEGIKITCNNPLISAVPEDFLSSQKDLFLSVETQTKHLFIASL
ncbi:MAG: hypothetical protein ACM3RX_03470, partial [Methanococcaceae archaeon]